MGEVIFNPTARPGDPDWRVLYGEVGDGAAGESRIVAIRPNPQRLDNLTGKIIRIIPDLNDTARKGFSSIESVIELLGDLDARSWMIVPLMAHKRVFGYYVLPFLLGDRLVARIDLKADRQQSSLRVLGGHAEPGIEPLAIAEPLAHELGLMATWLGLERVDVVARTALARQVRRALRAQESAS